MPRRRVIASKSGKTHDITDAPHCGSGGAGSVYDVGGGLVVKVLKHADANQLRALLHLHDQLEPHGVVMPVDLAVDAATREVVGYFMPFASGETLDEGLPDDLTKEQRLLVALAVAKALRAVHAVESPKLVYWDFKDANTKVDCTFNPPKVRLIDVDSACVFGIRDKTSGALVDVIGRFTTGGYKPFEYLKEPATPPGHPADLFALGVVLHQVLYGHTPYDRVGAATGDLEEAVRELRFQKYIPNGRPPTYAFDYGTDVDELFRKAFLGKPTERPTAAQWVTKFENLLGVDPPVVHPVEAKRVIRRPPNLTRLWRFTRRAAAVLAVVSIGAVAWHNRHLFASLPPPPAPPRTASETTPADPQPQTFSEWLFDAKRKNNR